MSDNHDTDATAARRLLTPQQVARLLNVSTRTVQRKAAGQIPAFRIGNRPGEAVRIDAAELEDWLVGEGKRMSPRIRPKTPETERRSRESDGGIRVFDSRFTESPSAGVSGPQPGQGQDAPGGDVNETASRRVADRFDREPA